MNSGIVRARGFTLLELMVVCVIVAILASVAYPGYQSYVQKTRRAEGKAALVAAAVQMERYLTERNTYATATLGAGGVYPTTTEHDVYTLSLANLTASTYTLRAVPVGAQAGDPCGTLTYTDAGVKDRTGTMALDRCW